MSMSRLSSRLQRLERTIFEHEEGVLHVWRLPEESAADSSARCEVDPADYPEVQVHLWVGTLVAPRLAEPPAPLWVSRTSPAIAALEHQWLEGLKQRRLPQ